MELKKMSLRVEINWREVYKILCKKCKEKLKQYIKTKLAEQLTDELLGEKESE